MRRVRCVGPFVWAALSPALSGCAPKVSAGEWQCSQESAGADGGPPRAALLTDPVVVPWSTGFEDSFCGYTNVAGYCYGDQPYTLVTEPHRPGGHFAAEFKVVGSQMQQTRCVRQGVLPESAYYGAWYFIPQALTDVKGVWNLWHFQGGDDPDSQHDLWDVTLVKGQQAGDWELVVYDRPSPPPNNTYRSADHIRVPIKTWFHIELFLKRAADATGEIALYQDGVQLFDRTNLKSDASKFTQWYVGDLADTATPADSSLYVDDVSISATLAPISATP